MTAETAPEQSVPAAIEREGEKTATERLIFFSDAVVAIAITLLALELPIPEGASPSAAWHDFLHTNFDAYLAFLISFVVIANQWFGHHWVFRYVTRVHRRIAGINMVWLLTVVLTPFATRVLVGDDTSFPMAFTLYAVIQAVSQLTFVSLILAICRDHLTSAGVPASAFHPAIARSLTFAVSFLVSIPLAYLTHWAFAFWATTPYVARVVILVIRRRRPEGALPATPTAPGAVALADRWTC